MKRLAPAKQVQGTLKVDGDKSIAHRAALLSILAEGQIAVINFPKGADCAASLKAAETLGVTVVRKKDRLLLTPPEEFTVAPETIIDCGNSGTTARLLAGLIAGSDLSVNLAGDDALSRRPMKRIVDPLTAMGAELFATEDHLPMKVQGARLLPFEYRMPVASAQVKSALLLAGLASSSSVVVQEEIVTRDHTEIMLQQLTDCMEVRTIKPVATADPNDPRKKRMTMPEPFKREIKLKPGCRLNGGELNIPGDISSAAFFMAAAAITGGTVTVEQVGTNPTRTAFLEHLRQIGCRVEITDRQIVSGEPRGTITVTGGALQSRRITAEKTVALIDEIPIVAVVAAFARGTTVIRDAGELKVKESDRLAAVSHNLNLMEVKCGLLEDGLAIEGASECAGADFKSFDDHRIAMAFSIAALACSGPSTIDNPDVVDVSLPDFFQQLESLTR
jgi:3-phosphoshikimate 1-carboxyvinyltransferase